MAIKELFYDQRPVALLNPRASQRIDPRFKFTRNSIGTYVDRDGIIKTASPNIPRLDYNPQSFEANGLLMELSASNYYLNSNNPLGNYTAVSHTMLSTSLLAPDGSTTAVKVVANNGLAPYTPATVGVQLGRSVPSGTYKFSVFAKAGEQTTFAIRENVSSGGFITADLAAGTVSGYGYGSDLAITPYANNWHRVSWTSYISTTNLSRYTYRAAVTGDGTSGFYLWGFQAEPGSELTSFIPTASATGTRAADLLSVDSLSIPSTGSVYIDARAITTDANDTLLSLKNASNQKINLAMEERSELYNSLALTYSIKGTVKPTLPYPVPTTNRERNIITWGTNNYQYNTDGARFAPSLSTTPGIPADLTQLSIGHDAVDPTKAFNGYINAVYLYNGEITPTVAEALVRGELDPINADTYSPVGPTGSLALIINTQGTTADGDKTFTLPAESALNDNDIVITWGDGTESGLDGAAAELGAAGLSHTYPSAGIYPVWVKGKLENLQFNNSASAPDLVKIEAWGTTADNNDVFLSPSTMNSAFYGCSQLQSMPTSGLPDTSAVTSWYRAFRGCSSLTGTFPSFNFSAATTFQEAFYGCSGLASFTAAGDQTQNVTNFASAWYNCSGLTSFPQINTSNGEAFNGAWFNCSGLPDFPLLNTAAGTNFAYAWYGCSNLASFKLLNTAAGTNFSNAWYGCTSLNNIGVVPGATTSFPLINTSLGIDFSYAWFNCVALAVFPLIDTSSGANFSYTWYSCSGLTAFPTLDFSSADTFSLCWAYCTGLTAFPTISTSSSVTSFNNAWRNCTSMATFGVVNTSSGTNFGQAWRDCNVLASFPALNFDSAQGSASDTSTSYTGFREAWFSCDALTDFPANRFNTTTCTRYLDAWTGCALTAQSIENILVSINAAGTSNGNLGIGGGTNAAKSTWTSAANTAYDALVARGWTITFNA